MSTVGNRAQKPFMVDALMHMYDRLCALPLACLPTNPCYAGLLLSLQHRCACPLLHDFQPRSHSFFIRTTRRYHSL